MADDSTSSRRRPVSLNDRHYRLLQDLSAPPKQQHSSHYSDAETQETKATMVKLVGRRRLCKVSDKKGVEVDGDNDSSFSDLEDFDSPGKDASKLEGIDGPPGVCSISFRDKPNVSKNVFVDEPMFSAITDFDSPSPPPKNVEQRNNCQGRNEIMDILDDLSSKLGSMSIQKKKSSQRNDLVDEFIGGGIKCAVDDFVDAESSFSSVDAPYKNEAISESLVDKQTKIKDANERRNEYRKLDREFSFVGQPRLIGTGSRIGESKKDTQSRKNGEIGERLRSVGSSNISRLRELEDDDDDDCVVTNDPKIYDFKQPVERSVKSDSSLEIDDEQVSEDVGSITLTGPRSTYSLPGKIATMLFPHQREGLKWLWSLHTQGKGGILGDDMGLGKTMQICSFLAGLFRSKLIKRAMVVAPKTLLPHWIKELTAVGLSEKIREYYGTCSRAREYELQYILQDKGVLLTTYDIVRNNTKSLKGDPRFADDEDEDCFMWDYMILDEGHLIKNPSTQRAKSLLEIPSAHRVIISGTPIQNNLKELWALFNFSCPGLLGDKKWFKEKYEYYILRGNDKNASEREKRIGSTVAKDLREHIQPFFLRRLKSEVFGEDDSKTSKLSKKNEIVVWLRLTSCQRQLYEAFLRSEIVLSAFDGSPLAALTILKKICDHPFLLTKRAAEDVLEGMDSMGATLTPEEAGVAEKLAMHIADVDDSNDFQAKHDSVSCKISFILSLLGNLIPEGHNVLIFSQTRKMLNLLQESLTSNGYKFLRIDGTTKATDRLQIVNDFQEGHMAPIFLLTSQVGGLGLTLTRADRVIVVDPAWNPSTDNQSVDRAYRIGQNKDVIVYRLMTCGTVEEKIYRKQVYKGGLFKTATEHKEQIRYFSQQDMRELFSLPKEGFDVSPTQQQLHEEHSSQIKMDEVLESHVKYLETQGIAGVSHHSLLFSKTAPVQVIEDEPEETRWKGATYMGRPSSSSSIDLTVYGAEYAFNPKDVKLNQKSLSPDSIDKDKLTESEIKARIHRLSLIFTNKNTVMRLPDKGAKLQKQIAELNSELDMMRMGKSSQTPHLVDLGDVSGKFQKVSIL